MFVNSLAFLLIVTSFCFSGETHGCQMGKKRLTKPFEMDETERLIIYSKWIGMTSKWLVKIFERMVITAERLKNMSNGSPERLNGFNKISIGWSCTGEGIVMTGGARIVA